MYIIYVYIIAVFVIPICQYIQNSVDILEALILYLYAQNNSWKVPFLVGFYKKNDDFILESLNII